MRREGRREGGREGGERNLNSEAGDKVFVFLFQDKDLLDVFFIFHFFLCFVLGW